MKEKEIRRQLLRQSKEIPDFIDTTSKEGVETFNLMNKVLGIFNVCIINEMLSQRGLDEISTHYYSCLLAIHRINPDLYPIVMEYLMEIYDETIKDLDYWELYEASYNLVNMVNIKQFNE